MMDGVVPGASVNKGYPASEAWMGAKIRLDKATGHIIILRGCFETNQTTN